MSLYRFLAGKTLQQEIRYRRLLYMATHTLNQVLQQYYSPLATPAMSACVIQWLTPNSLFLLCTCKRYFVCPVVYAKPVCAGERNKLLWEWCKWLRNLRGVLRLNRVLSSELHSTMTPHWFIAYTQILKEHGFWVWFQTCEWILKLILPTQCNSAIIAFCVHVCGHGPLFYWSFPLRLTNLFEH